MDFFESFEQGMDQQLASYLSSTAANLCAVLAPIVATGVVIYIMLIGYAIIRGEAQDSLHSAMWKAVKWALIAAVALSAGGFNTYVVGGLNGIEAGLFQATTGAVNGGQLLDDCLSQYVNLFNQLIQNVNSNGFGWPNIPICISIALIAVACLVFFGLAVCVFMLAKVAAVLVIALGPAFIATLIFPPIQRFADAWLSAALNTVVIKVLAAIILAISTLFLKKMVEHVAGGFSATQVFMDCLKILILSVTFGAIFGYLPMLAAQLVGGSPLPHVTMPRFRGRGGGSSRASSRSSSSSEGGSLQPSRNLPYTSQTPAYRRNVIGNLNR